jgi:hypothetical protein
MNRNSGIQNGLGAPSFPFLFAERVGDLKSQPSVHAEDTQ